MAVRGGRISKIVAGIGNPCVVMSASTWVKLLAHCGVGEDDGVWMMNVPSSVWVTWFLPECGYGLVFLVKSIFCPPGTVVWPTVRVDLEEREGLALESVHS